MLCMLGTCLRGRARDRVRRPVAVRPIEPARLCRRDTRGVLVIGVLPPLLLDRLRKPGWKQTGGMSARQPWPGPARAVAVASRDMCTRRAGQQPSAPMPHATSWSWSRLLPIASAAAGLTASVVPPRSNAIRRRHTLHLQPRPGVQAARVGSRPPPPIVLLEAVVVCADGVVLLGPHDLPRLIGLRMISELERFLYLGGPYGGPVRLALKRHPGSAVVGLRRGWQQVLARVIDTKSCSSLGRWWGRLPRQPRRRDSVRAVNRRQLAASPNTSAFLSPDPAVSFYGAAGAVLGLGTVGVR